MKGETTCSSAVEVVVRVRPLQPALKESATAWSWTSSAPSTEAPHTSTNVITELANRDARFTFDAVFPPESSTELLYVQRIRHDVVRRTAQGYNGTVLAYGQTGSGKTYTMFGSHSTAEVRGSSPPSSSAGLIDLALTDLFAALAEEKSTDQHLRSVRVDVSIVELYNEHLRDLLATEATSPLSIREHAQGTYVHNAVRIQVGDLFGCLDLIHQHAAQRVCGATAMNENSSRSHCIAQVRVEREYDDRATNNNNNNNNTHLDEKQTLVVEHAQPTRVVCSSLTFVDLAGSERVSKSAAVGQRMVEGGHINKSLTSLAMVIQRVVEQQQQQQRVGSTAFVPYRDSKLTHLLKSSLGGNAYTCIVCCISPSMESVAESRGTLQFAARAKRVENRAIINERLSHAAEVRGLELALKHVREQLVVNRIFLWSKEAKVKRLGAQVDHLASLWSSHVCGEAGSATAPSERSRADVLVRLRYLEEENTLLRQELHSSANSTITTKTGQTSSHNRVLEDLRTEVLELGKMVERVEGERDEVQHSLTELESITQELEEESLKWEARAGQLTTCNATLTEQVEELIHGKEALRREVDLLRAQIAERWTSLPKDGAGVVEHLRAALHDEEGAHAEACRVASEDKHMMQRQMKALQNECDAIKVERDRMIADAAGLREDLRRMMHATSELLGIVEEPSKMDAATDDDGVQGRIIALQRLVRRLRAAHPANDGASMIASLRSPTTHRDLIVDAKLKRMQDLVLRLHTTNTLISQELSSHHRDKMLLLDLVKELDASAESVAMERGVLRLQPLDALLAKVRYTAETQRPGKPMGHN